VVTLKAGSQEYIIPVSQWILVLIIILTTTREEMVYYRAFNFQIAPPQADQIWFTNHSGQHAFTVEANFSEGSNDIDSCNLNVEDEDGNSVIYDESDGVEAIQVDDTTSRCVYDRIRYDDHPSGKLNITTTMSLLI